MFTSGTMKGQRVTEIYGLKGITHGWAKVLTVMGREGASALAARIETDDDVSLAAAEGRLTQYVERRKGGLDRLIAVNGIVLLSKADWDAKKAELGPAILL